MSEIGSGPEPLERALERADRWLDADRPAEAERELRQALTMAPDDPHVRFELARALIALERWEEAEEHVDAGLSVYPESAFGFGLLGLIQKEQGRNSEAEANLLEGLRIDPTEPFLYVAYGQLMLVTGHLDRSERLVTSISCP